MIMIWKTVIFHIARISSYVLNFSATLDFCGRIQRNHKYSMLLMMMTIIIYIDIWPQNCGHYHRMCLKVCLPSPEYRKNLLAIIIMFAFIIIECIQGMNIIYTSITHLAFHSYHLLLLFIHSMAICIFAAHGTHQYAKNQTIASPPP